MDLRTLYIIAAVTALLIGLAQIAVHATGRLDRSLLWWGASNVLCGIGNLIIASQDAPGGLTTALANLVIFTGCLLLLGGVRAFAGRRLQCWAIIGAGLSGASSLWFQAPEDYATRIAIGSLFMAALEFAVAFEAGRLAIREGLRSCWIITALFIATGILYLVRTEFMATGQGGGAALFASGAENHAAIAVVATAVIVLRAMMMMMLVCERHWVGVSSLAYRDPLTAALTRAGLRHGKEVLLRKHAPGSVLASVVLIDVDNFKGINDTYGHSVGDDLLCAVAHAAQGVLPKGGLVARWGGDEFVLLLPGLTANGALCVADALRQAFGERNQAIGGPGERPTLSIGIAEGHLRVGGIAHLLEQADGALYHVKRNGRDGVRIAGERRPSLCCGEKNGIATAAGR